MLLTDLVNQLQTVLMDAGEKFEGRLEGIIETALRDFSRRKPLTLQGEITLQADVDCYPAPAGLIDVKVHQWGRAQRRLPFWDPSYPRNLPRVYVREDAPGMLQLSFPPSADQIARLGARFPFTYNADRTIQDGNVPVLGRDVDILLIRAQAEVMRQLANQNIGRPIATRDVVGSQPRNGTPAALCELYLSQFKEMLNAA